MPIAIPSKPKQTPADDLRKRQEQQIIAAAQSAKTKALHKIQLGRCFNWAALSEILNFEVSAAYSSQPFCRDTYMEYLDWYVDDQS